LNTTGNFNTIVGSQTGVLNTTGENNTFMGNGAGYNNSTGSENVYLGEQTGSRNTTGGRNTYVGDKAGKYNITGSGNVLVGYGAGFRESGSNKLYIANDTINPLIRGDFSSKELVFNGKVGVETTSFPSSVGGENLTGYKLFVKGGILAEEVRIRTDWADYVFDDSYDLKSLSEVKRFIDLNHHLPNIPSAREVHTSGISLGKVAKAQMEKIEELTLYLIKQDELIKKLAKRIDDLEGMETSKRTNDQR
jgi:hypothetical protein